MSAVDVLVPVQFSAATHAGPLRHAPLLRLEGRSMGTGWSVQLVNHTLIARDALQRGIEAQLARLVAQLSHWEPQSALGRYNTAPAGSRHRLPVDFATVLDAALAIAAASGGALDPTLGPLVDLWGFGPPGPRAEPPGAEQVNAAQQRCGWQRLQRDGDEAGDDGLLLQPGGVQLDFSAIAKGHAVDVVAGWLQRLGFVNHLVEIGGELRGQGVKPDGMPWWVDIETPPGIEARPVRIALDGLSVATSGDAIRHVEHEGQRLAHTLDPRSGRPLQSAPASVTVIHPLCREADGWATALGVLGPDSGLALADDRGLAVRWLLREVAPSQAVICSAAWRALCESEDSLPAAAGLG